MATLNEATKTTVVTMLAQFCSASEIAAYLLSEEDISVDRFQIRTYDPTRSGYAAGDKWRILFDEVRANYLRQIDAVPISHLGYRLNQLQRNFDRATVAKNLVLANSILEQAAKEVGGTMTNERKFGISTEPRLSAEERKRQLIDLIDRTLGHLPQSV